MDCPARRPRGKGLTSPGPKALIHGRCRSIDIFEDCASLPKLAELLSFLCRLVANLVCTENIRVSVQ